MKSIDSRARRFKHPREQQEEYLDLWMGATKESKKYSGSDSIFKDLKDIFIFSAILGFENRRRKSFKEGISFKADFKEYESIIYSIAICEYENKDEKELGELLDRTGKEKIETIIEEYACGGFEILKDKLYRSASTPLEALKKLILDEEEENPFEKIL